MDVPGQFGGFLPSGSAISSTRYATGTLQNGNQAKAVWNGTGYDIVDLGVRYGNYQWVSSSGTNDDGTSLLMREDFTVLFDGAGQVLYGIDNPAGKSHLSGEILMGNSYSYATFYPTGTIENPSVFRIRTEAVPEPASIAALGLGALAAVRRRHNP